MTDRVRRPKEFEEFMSELRDDEKNKVFDSYKNCILFCAALCAKQGKNFKESFNESAEPIMLAIFHGEYDKAFINALAIFDTDDAMVISPDREEERIKILEQYACGGLRILQGELFKDISAEKQIIALLKRDILPENIINDITNFNVIL